jgi:hypothetical protein
MLQHDCDYEHSDMLSHNSLILAGSHSHEGFQEVPCSPQQQLQPHLKVLKLISIWPGCQDGMMTKSGSV